MFKRAFMQYIEKNSYPYFNVVAKIEALMLMLVLYLLTHHMFDFWLLQEFGLDVGEWTLTLMYGVFGFAIPFLRFGLAAAIYAAPFIYHYDVVDRHIGYHAFRLNREQQEYQGLYYERFPVRQEKIIASANMSADCTIWAVMEPGRHHHCIAYMAQHNANERPFQQGFLTNQYRFVTREEARAMAMRNGQVPEPDHERHLFSEDLWETPQHMQYRG